MISRLHPVVGLVGLALLIAAMVPAAAVAQTFPTLTGRVVDDAGILDGTTRRGLDRKLAELEPRPPTSSWSPP
jgi:uncharacterized protein